MEYNTKNYSEQGGDKLVIGGELEVKPGAVVKGLGLSSARAAENQPDSTAGDLARLVVDFNALLRKMIASGIMEEYQWR